jgi:Ca-activated chloride channel homolog
VSDVDARDDGGAAVIRVPDLLVEEVRHLVLGVRLAPRAVALDAPVSVVEVEVSFERLEGGRVVRERAACRASVAFVAAAEAQARPTPGVDEVVAIAELVRRQIEAEEAARRGDFAGARQTMVLFQAAIVARGHDAVGSAAGKLADRLGTADAYDGSAAYRSSMRKGATRNVTSLYRADADADLRAMGRAAKTRAQDRMEDAFGAGTPGSNGHRAEGRGGLARRRSRRW